MGHIDPKPQTTILREQTAQPTEWSCEAVGYVMVYRLSFDSENGTKVLLQRLAASPLVRRTLPNAAAICQQYFSFRRNPSESIGNFLVRETLVHEEFVEAIIRLHEEKVGISQEARDFGLPAESDGDWGEWNDASWTAGGWDWWNDDGYDGEAADLPDGDSPEHRSPGEGAEGQAGAEPPVAAPGSSPSHRGDGDAPLPREPAEAALQSDQAEVPREAVDEMSVADSFILGVLRGWRLLQAAGLSAEEKRDILSSTKNSLDYEVVAAALQSLWDDQLLGSPQPLWTWKLQPQLCHPGGRLLRRVPDHQWLGR